jgi:hypothetical protein
VCALSTCDHGGVETMAVRVLGFDAVHVGTFVATSYTVFADGRLELTFPDGSVKRFGWDEWIDVRATEAEE